MRLTLDGKPEWLPADWILHVVTIGASQLVEVERLGRRMTLDEALTLRDLETTSSKPHLRTRL